jgi:hypothetical protein
MLYGQRDLPVIKIYNMEDELIADLDFLQDVNIKNDNGKIIIELSSNVLSDEILNIYSKQMNDLTTNKKVFTFNANNTNAYRIVAETYLRDNNGNDHKCVYEFPYAVALPCIDVKHLCVFTAHFDLRFKASSYNLVIDND